MLTRVATTLALAVGLGVAGLTALPSSADARIFIHHHEGFFFGGPIFLGPPIVYENPGNGPCYWLHIRAERTGSSYWWSRWNSCRVQYYGGY